MAQLLITVKLMPQSPDVNLTEIGLNATKEIEKFGGKIGKIEQEPIAFGLKAVILYFYSDESKSNLDPLEDSLRNVKDVESVEIIGVTRAL